MTKIEAIEESIVIWNELAKHNIGVHVNPEVEKSKIVDGLFLRKSLRNRYYRSACPLCELYNNANRCEDCPWPGNERCRCLDGTINLYADWLYANHQTDRKKVAESIVVMLKHLRDKELEETEHER